MCGISGIIYKNDNIKREEIKLLTNTLAHRGPDGEGFYFGENFALGHRRLSIIDLSPAGHQPMEFKGKHGEYVIVYNGEIYNYIEIKEELKKDGYFFNSNTDTEVILAAYDKWGTNCLDKFNGMWALVIYDKQKKIFFGARDRFGVKPFYFINNDKVFAFASEIKALLKLPYYKKDINEDVIFEYLFLGIEEQENSIFKGIYELFPSNAFILNIEDFSIKEWKYYELTYYDKYEKFDLNKLKSYTEDIRNLIFDAVRIRLRADVPVGSCLSGGLDSSTIVCVINEIIKKENIPQVGFKQNVFTASYEDKKVDESNFAEIVVNYTKTEWHKTYPTDESLLNDLQELIYYQEIPFGSTSMYAQYKVMQIAKQNGVKVLLDGQGGDEIFTGYLTYYPVFFKEMVFNLDLVSIFRELKNLNNSPVSLSYIFSYLFKNILKDLIPKNIISYIFYATKNKSHYFKKDFLFKFKNRLSKYIDSIPNSLNEQLNILIKNRSLKALLKYEDRNSMRFSIESRTPFADDIKLIEYVFNIPSAYKIHNGWSKYILRESMKNILPEDIRLRKSKIGFATPENNWLISKKEFFINILEKERKLLKNYIELENLIKDYKNNKIFNEDFLIWRIINFVLWYKIFFDN